MALIRTSDMEVSVRINDQDNLLEHLGNGLSMSLVKIKWKLQGQGIQDRDSRGICKVPLRRRT